jgi:hypothetical protein
MLKQLGFCCVLLAAAVATPVDAQESPTYQLPPMTVPGQPESQELVGPYHQPRWTTRGRFSTDTEVYVIPPGLFFVDVDYQGTVPRHGKSVHLFTQEFEVGLPYRLQFAYENNVEVREGHTQVTTQNLEARYALADWGIIPLNPTLFAEYKIGVGKDYERQEETHTSVAHIPDAFEVRLLLGEQFGRKFQWALNLFHEQQLGGERERESGFSQALTYPIHDEYLKTGIEMQFIRRTSEESRAHPTYDFILGPNFTWKPSPRTRLDLAALFGTTSDSPTVKVFAVFSFFFGIGREEAEDAGPVSTRNR